MNLQERLEAAQKAVADAASLVKSDPAETNVKALEDAVATRDDLDGRVKRARVALDDMEGSAKSGPEVADRRSLGERFVKAAPYADWKAKHPAGAQTQEAISLDGTKVGTLAEYDYGRKALTTDVAHLPPQQYGLIDQVQRPELSLLDLVSKGTIGSTSLEYLQVTAITRNAALVAENTGNDATDTLKPISTLATALETAKVFGYADGYEVTNQLLSDAPALATYLNSEFRYSLSNVIEDMLLNGTGVGGQPRGLLNTTGVQQLTYATSPSIRTLIEAVRKAKTKLRNTGGTAQAVLMNPEDDEAIDLLADNDGRYFSNGPFGVGPATLWGLRRVLSDRIPVGTAVVGEFSQIALLDYEGLSVVAFNQHKDFAQRNLTYVRAELRAAQTIWRPSRLVVIEKA